METLNGLVDALESKMPAIDSANTKVSQSGVSWHIAHTLKVIYKVIDTLEHSDPQQYRWRFNGVRSLVYTLNRIPRGKGKAPKSVLPAEELTAAVLEEEFKKARAAIAALENLTGNSHFMHPYFGQLNLRQTKKFLALHTKHHLKIIKDILEK